MLKFEPLLPQQRTQYDPILQNAGERGCEYSFTNLCLWGRQRVTRVGDYLAFCPNITAAMSTPSLWEAAI